MSSRKQKRRGSHSRYPRGVGPPVVYLQVSASLRRLARQAQQVHTLVECAVSDEVGRDELDLNARVRSVSLHTGTRRTVSLNVVGETTAASTQARSESATKFGLVGGVSRSSSAAFSCRPSSASCVHA